MGRYIGTPESLVSEIENIVPVASRFNTRCLYTTPGTYSFTVPSGVSSITAVAVGPGGTQCSVLRCVITCGKIKYLNAAIMVNKCLDCQTSCCFACKACNPTDATCLCAFNVCRYLCVNMQKMQWCIYHCVTGDISSSNCVNCDIMYEFGLMNQTQYFSHLPSGPGGGYVEKTANTAAGCVYSVVVGQNCTTGGFSCVNGYNISICATGPTLSSTAGDLTCGPTCDIYWYCSGSWVCMSPENIVGPNCMMCAASCVSPNVCWACQCRWGSYSDLCYCVITRWCGTCRPGCGFGGDINRVGGWCVLNLVNNLVGSANTSYYQYDCNLCTLATTACLCGKMFSCTGGTSGIMCACCNMMTCAVSNSCCTTIGEIGSYNFIRGYLDCMNCFSNKCQTCYYTEACLYVYQCFLFSQQIREVGNTISCITNFDTYAPGTHNPYCPAGLAATNHSLGWFMTCLCFGDCASQNGYYYCPSSGDICYNMTCSHAFYYDFMLDTQFCNDAFRCMNCLMTACGAGNACNRYKFGGSSAGNYFRNGVSGLADDSTYTLCCNRNWGHCCTTPYVTCCAYNCGFIQTSSTPVPASMLLSHCFSCFAFNQFPDLFCACHWCTGNCQAYGHGGSTFDCMYCHGKRYGYPTLEICGNSFADMYCNTYYSGCDYVNSLDNFDVRLPNALTSCSSGFTGFKWKQYNNPYLRFFGNQMFNTYGAVNGCYNCACHGYHKLCAMLCDSGAYFGPWTGPFLRTAVWPARTCLKYYSVAGYPCSLNLCHMSGPNVLKCVVPGSCACDVKCSQVMYCGNGAYTYTGGFYRCYFVGTHTYWPNCIGYNYCTTTCTVSNINPLINLYDYFCSSPSDCGVTSVGITTPFCHQQTFGYYLTFPEKWMTLFYYPNTANTATPCCVWKSSDNITITDQNYLAQYTAGLCMYGCSGTYYSCCNGDNCLTCCFKFLPQLQRFKTGVCFNQVKTTSGNTCDLSGAGTYNYAQGGAGIGTAGIWGEGAITCSLLCSGGGNIKCIVPCCNITMCWYDGGIGTGSTCTVCKAMGWGLGPNQVSLQVVDLTGCGSGALISPCFIGIGCSCGWGSTIGGCTGNLPFNALCVGCSAISHVDLINSGGINYTSACTVVCANIDACVFQCFLYRNVACAFFGCCIAFACACWSPVAGTFRCEIFVTTNGCCMLFGCCRSPIIVPLFCAIVQPTFATYSCVASTYAEGSGGGSKTGVSYCAKYATIIDSPTIVSITPARGGRGNESPYSPYYYSYPGISARLSTPKGPSQYVGDPTTGCSWFDTPQINGSGGNGMFCSRNFSCIYVQEPGPGGGGANGIKFDGTISPNGGILGGGAGCCGSGGYGGGAGWMGTPGTGMVVIYWNA